MGHVMIKSFYAALLVDPSASADEIKLAFKRRALQVHPDKGGSKEAFHVVYQALQTLTDPVARKKYDKSLANSNFEVASDDPWHAKPKKKTRGKGCRSTSKPKAAKTYKTTGRSGKTPTKSGGACRSSLSKQQQLLVKIHQLLKELPRDARSDIIQKEFSQKQRLILEKWMVDTFPSAHSEAVAAIGEVEIPKESKAGNAFDSDRPFALAAPSAADWVTTRCSSKPKKCIKHKFQPRRDENLSLCGCVRKNRSLGKGGSYRARIRFDAIYIEMFSAKCDLPTALEYLLILTSVKQKMLVHTNPCFEHRIKEALVSSAKEHGKDFVDLELRFAVVQGAGVFIGSELRTPIVHSIGELGKLRAILHPFREFANKNWGRRGPFRLYSPAYLQEQWEEFQKAVANAWNVVGADSSKIIQKISSLYDSTSCLRDKHLRAWENKHMAMQDKKRRCQDGNSHKEKTEGLVQRLRPLDNRRAKQLQAWERKKMCLEDRNKHRPRKWRVPVRKQQSVTDIVTKKSLALKKLLVRWQRWLIKEAQSIEKERRTHLRQQKKDRAERRRAQVLAQRCAREEERVKRQAWQKRRKIPI